MELCLTILPDFLPTPQKKPLSVEGKLPLSEIYPETEMKSFQQTVINNQKTAEMSSSPVSR